MLKLTTFAPLAFLAVAALGAPTDASAETVACIAGNSHPVCVAAFAKYPAGSKATGSRMSGTATINGKRVNWTCTGGTRTTPRQCTF